MDNYEKLNAVLVHLFNHTMDIEERILLSGEFKDISVNDMHIMNAIGPAEPKSMSVLAKAVGVTVGTLTIAMNNLVKKGYVNRERSVTDRRVVLISLSEKGRRAYQRHELFHIKMIEAMRQGLDDGQCEILIQALSNLKRYFEASVD